MGRLGRFGTGACPNLLQRRPAAGSAASRSAEYQRFASGASARSGSLQQIWTTGVAAGPCTDGDLLVRGPEAGPTGRGPLHGRRPRRSLRSWTGPAPTPGCRGVHFALERALLTAPFECKMHISTSTGPTRPPPPRTAPARTAPRRPRSRTTTPGEKGPVGSRRRSSAWTTCVRLDYLCSVGPLMFRWTTCVRLDHLVHEIRWSNGTQVVQPHLSGPSRSTASRHARRRPTMRDALSRRSGAGRRPHPLRPGRPAPGSRRPERAGPPIPPRPTPPTHPETTRTPS